MEYYNESYFSALLQDLSLLTSPKEWVLRHSVLFSRYVNVERVCSLLERPSDIMRRASDLSGKEIGTASPAVLYQLQSVFCRLNVGGEASAAPKCYKCRPLDLTNPFPTESEGSLSGDPLASLDQDLEAAAKDPPEDIPAFLALLDTLLKKHLWCVPAGTGPGIDVSLYDKMRSTAAIFACLARTGEAPEPFLLLAADFSGIQNYIFTVAQTNTKGVSKRLRARSFLVDVMVQTLAYRICEELKVPYGNILMLTGGKFYLLLPNTRQTTDRLHALGSQVEDDLFRRFYGDISVNLAWVTFGDDGLIDYSSTITELSRRLRAEKGRALRSVLIDEGGWREDEFILTDDLAGKRSCPSCGRRLMDRELEICPECRRQEELGGKLATARYLWFSRDGGEFQLWEHSYVSFPSGCAKGPLFRVEQLNNWDIPADMTRYPFAVRLMANQLPKAESGEPLTFGDIAERSAGSKRLAVLKADVDNLGYLFADGMRGKTGHYGTISRVSTLSRLLEMFFSGYISHLLRTEFPSVYSVFSGGDDLFLIGPWDVMPRMALRVQQEFSAFSGHNPCVTLSAALYTANPKTNIALLAEQSEQELKRVKNSAPQALYPGKQGRNGVSFCGDIFSWPDLEAQLDNIDRLRPEVQKVNVAVLRRMAQYSEMYRGFLDDHDVLGLMFEPLLHYDRQRNYGAVPQAVQAYAQGLTKNAADYRTVNLDLYFAKTVIACILNQTKEARENGI